MCCSALSTCTCELHYFSSIFTTESIEYTGPNTTILMSPNRERTPLEQSEWSASKPYVYQHQCFIATSMCTIPAFSVSVYQCIISQHII